MNKACVVTAHATMPDEFRTMAACEALGTMLPVFEQYDSLVVLVLREVLRSVYEDPELVMDQFLAWLRPQSAQQPAMAPSEAMFLKSKPHFARCRDLRSQIDDLEQKMLVKEKHEGTLLSNLTNARNTMRAVLGKDSLLITRERELEQNQDTVRKDEGTKDASISPPSPTRSSAQESAPTSRAASTLELIAASLVQQAKEFMAKVQEQEETRTGRQVILASISTLAAAVKKAEGQIKLDLGADLADADDEDESFSSKTFVTKGTQTEGRPSPLFDVRKSGRQQETTSSSPKHATSCDSGVNGSEERDSAQQILALEVVILTPDSLHVPPGSWNTHDSDTTGMQGEITANSSRAIACSKLSCFALKVISIPDIYARKMVADASDDIRGASRAEPIKAIEAFLFDDCKGDGDTALLKLRTLKSAVQKYGSSGDGRVGLFGVITGWVHEKNYAPQAMDLYLAIMSGIFSGRARQLLSRMNRGEGWAYMPLQAVTPVIERLVPIMEEETIPKNHCSKNLSYEEASDTPHSRTWAISEARKINLTRSVISMARPAGEVLVGSATYAEYFSVDPLVQIVDIDLALEKVMRAWFEQRQERRRYLLKAIETRRTVGIGEGLDFPHFGDMLWNLWGPVLSAPTVRRLFDMTACLNSMNKAKFSFRQAGALAEQVLRMLSPLTPDRERALAVLKAGHERMLKDQAQSDWQEISMKDTRKTTGEKLRFYVLLQARMRGWKIRWENAMATRIQRLARGYMIRRRGMKTRRC